MDGSWKCETCHVIIHATHFTEKGINVECTGCERKRKDDKMLVSRGNVAKKAAKADPGDRLDIPGK